MNHRLARRSVTVRSRVSRSVRRGTGCVRRQLCKTAATTQRVCVLGLWALRPRPLGRRFSGRGPLPSRLFYDVFGDMATSYAVQRLCGVFVSVMPCRTPLRRRSSCACGKHPDTPSELAEQIGVSRLNVSKPLGLPTRVRSHRRSARRAKLPPNLPIPASREPSMTFLASC